MWHDHLFSQRNKATKRALGLGLGYKKKGGGGEEVGKNLKKQGREYRCGLKKNRGPLIMVYTHMQ